MRHFKFVEASNYESFRKALSEGEKEIYSKYGHILNIKYQAFMLNSYPCFSAIIFWEEGGE